MPAHAREPPEPASGVGPTTAGPVGLSAVLARHRGTVTDLLEQLAAESVEADVRAQWSGPAGPDNPLGLDPTAELVRRAVLLRGRASGRAYAYAETSIAAARLPVAVRRRLERSRDPIGRVLEDHRLSVEREPLTGPATAVHADASLAGVLARAPVSRRYRIVLATGPAFAVDEWFLRPAADALARRLPG